MAHLVPAAVTLCGAEDAFDQSCAYLKLGGGDLSCQWSDSSALCCLVRPCSERTATARRNAINESNAVGDNARIDAPEQTRSGVDLMTDTKNGRSFAGAAELVMHAEAATQYVKDLCAACANGDKLAARKALRRAISELEVARAMLRTGAE